MRPESGPYGRSREDPRNQDIRSPGNVFMSDLCASRRGHGAVLNPGQ